MENQFQAFDHCKSLKQIWLMSLKNCIRFLARPAKNKNFSSHAKLIQPTSSAASDTPSSLGASSAATIHSNDACDNGYVEPIPWIMGSQSNPIKSFQSYSMMCFPKLPDGFLMRNAVTNGQCDSAAGAS